MPEPQPTPKLSIVMVDGAFRESYHAVDFFCTQTLPPQDFELIWVEYYDTIAPALSEKIARYPNARVITLNRTGVYHSSYCFNAGIAASRGEVILIPDADQVAEPDLLAQVWDMHQTDDRLVMYLFRYEEAEDLHQTPITLPHLRRVCVLKGPNNFGACLTVRKKWLLAINGYEQHPVFATGFHANGQDINTRLKNLGLPIMWHPRIRLYHPWHPYTKFVDDSHRRQEVVIRYRAVNLLTTAYDGIDPAQNHPLPSDLAEQLAAFDHALEEARSHQPTAHQPSFGGRLRRALEVLAGRA